MLVDASALGVIDELVSDERDSFRLTIASWLVNDDAAWEWFSDCVADVGDVVFDVWILLDSAASAKKPFESDFIVELAGSMPREVLLLASEPLWVWALVAVDADVRWFTSMFLFRNCSAFINRIFS